MKYFLWAFMGMKYGRKWGGLIMQKTSANGWRIVENRQKNLTIRYNLMQKSLDCDMIGINHSKAFACLRLSTDRETEF